MSERSLFILAGNGPYLNRGCEAIVRGTMKILEQNQFDPRFLCVSFFSSSDEYEKQKQQEMDERIRHLSAYVLRDMKASSLIRPKAWSYLFRRYLNEGRLGYSIYGEMLSQLPEAASVLSVGGDNYSLDYGVPRRFTALDDLVLHEDRPLFIWGASVGPFSTMPRFERKIGGHLKKVSGIFARESTTIEYLDSIGVVDNVHRVADPAFVMDPVRPRDVERELALDDEVVGLNLSPLMAKYVTGGDVERWAGIAASIIDEVVERTGLMVCLIPHVTTSSSDDHSFMKRALSLTTCSRSNVVLIPPIYDAAETKWIIGNMSVFAGARTHSTIAALSCLVPTLSFSYSIKSRGINQDIYGHDKYCIPPTDLRAKEVASRITAMLSARDVIRRELGDRVPMVQGRAFDAGKELKRILGRDDHS